MGYLVIVAGPGREKQVPGVDEARHICLQVPSACVQKATFLRFSAFRGGRSLEVLRLITVRAGPSDIDRPYSRRRHTR